jgi:beta-lactamase regulating signal transducer with metallopeptidase domain
MHFPFDWTLTASTPWLALVLAGALKATVLLAFAWVATRFLRRAPAAARHLIWTLALVAAIGLPLAALVVPAWPLGWVPSLTMGGGNVAPPPASMRVNRQDPKPADALPSQTIANRPSMRAPSDVASRIEDDPVARAGNTPLVQSSETPATSPTPPPGFSWPAIDARTILRLAPMIWLLGAIVLLGRRALAAIRIGRLGRRATPVTDWEWRGALQRHAASLGITPTPALLISDEADVPMTFGTLRPVIVVPAASVEWTPARRDVVLLHELGHIRRRDTLALLIGQLAAALYWFHPLVWVAKRGQRVEAEHACDDQVLRSGALASAYARELLELATAARPHDTYGAAALAMARRSQLEGRLLTILDPRSARGGVGRRFAALAVVLTVAATGALAAARPAREAITESAEIAAVAAESRATGSIATANAPADPTPVIASEAPADIVAEPYGPELALAPVTSDATPVVASTSTSVSVSTGGGDPAVTGSAESGSAIAVLADPPVTAKAAASSKDDHRNSSWSIHDDNGVLKSVNGTWEDDGFEGTFKSKGEIRFNDALDDVESITSGGSLTVEEVRPNGDRYRAEFRLKDGEIQRTWWVGSSRREWGPEARQWFKGYLIETDHRSGMLARQRFPRLMKEGGPRRVMDEISLMTSDYGKGIYFRMLIESGLGKEDLRRAVTQAGKEVESDYELARILATTAEKGALTDQATRTAFVTAVDGIESDYEHARVLMMVLEQPKLDPALANDALRSASRVGSDYERARLLVKMAEKGNVTPESQREYLRAARGIKSDYEKSRALRALVENESVTGANVAVLLSAAASVSSDYECGNVLVAIAGSVKLDAAGKQAYVETANAIGSTYERNRALAALGESAASY